MDQVTRIIDARFGLPYHTKQVFASPETASKYALPLPLFSLITHPYLPTSTGYLLCYLVGIYLTTRSSKFKMKLEGSNELWLLSLPILDLSYNFKALTLPGIIEQPMDFLRVYLI